VRSRDFQMRMVCMVAHISHLAHGCFPQGLLVAVSAAPLGTGALLPCIRRLTTRFCVLVVSVVTTLSVSVRYADPE